MRKPFRILGFVAEYKFKRNAKYIEGYQCLVGIQTKQSPSLHGYGSAKGILPMLNICVDIPKLPTSFWVSSGNTSSIDLMIDTSFANQSIAQQVYSMVQA